MSDPCPPKTITIPGDETQTLGRIHDAVSKQSGGGLWIQFLTGIGRVLPFRRLIAQSRVSTISTSIPSRGRLQSHGGMHYHRFGVQPLLPEKMPATLHHCLGTPSRLAWQKQTPFTRLHGMALLDQSPTPPTTAKRGGPINARSQPRRTYHLGRSTPCM